MTVFESYCVCFVISASADIIDDGNDDVDVGDYDADDEDNNALEGYNDFRLE